MSTLQVADDIALEYRVAGAGPELAFVSGSGGDLRAPAPIRDALEAHFTVLSWDQRGLGRSSRPDRPFTMADYAADAVALLDHLGWERALVAGVSFGGMVAQELAVTHPSRVVRLALLCTSAGGAGGASYPLHELPDLPDRELAIFRLELADRRRDGDWRAAHPEALERILADTARIRAIGADEPGRDAGARRQLEARAGHDVWDRLVELDVDTLVMGGLHDAIAPPENVAAIASQIPRARLQMYDGGHLFFVQDARAVPDLLAFLSGP